MTIGEKWPQLKSPKLYILPVDLHIATKLCFDHSDIWWSPAQTFNDVLIDVAVHSWARAPKSLRSVPLTAVIPSHPTHCSTIEPQIISARLKNGSRSSQRYELNTVASSRLAFACSLIVGWFIDRIPIELEQWMALSDKILTKLLHEIPFFISLVFNICLILKIKQEWMNTKLMELFSLSGWMSEISCRIWMRYVHRPVHLNPELCVSHVMPAGFW